MDKYPFVVTILRKDTRGGPVYQQHNFELLVQAIQKMDSFVGNRDKSIVRVSLSVVLRTVIHG
jgi:hypothetical protein